MVREIGQDIRHTFRVIRKNPGFASVVVATLALGIGVNTAIFSVVDGILFRPLPFPDEDRLVSVWADYTGRDGPIREWLSYPNFADLRGERDVFAEIGVYGGWGPTLTGAGAATRLTGAVVTAGMFSGVLRVRPRLGRSFLPEEDRPGAPNTVIISHGLWTRAFGADSAIIGRTVVLDREPFNVIGVMPPGFRPPFVPNADMWQTVKLDPATTANARGAAILRGVGRLQPDVTLATARARADVVAANLATQYPEANVGVGYALFSLRDDVVRGASTGLLVLLGAVIVVLTIACVNVANLTLARTTARRAELAVRAALGAGGGRIARQILTESLVLALLGGGLGLAAAFLGTDLLRSLAPAGTPRIADVAVDGRILGFTIAATLAVGVLFGVLPAFRAAREDLHGSLKDGGRHLGSGPAGARLRHGLVVAQVALALLLIVGAGLLVRTLGALHSLDPGFNADNKLTLQLNLPPAQYPDRAATRAFYTDLEDRLRAVPGVTAVASINSLPLGGFDGDADFNLEGEPPAPPGKESVAWIRRVTPGYFATMEIDVVAGRAFTSGDDADAALVVMINQTLAERQFGQQSPVGRRVYFGDPAQPVYREIVGVVEDVKNFGLRNDSRMAMYFPYDQVAVGAMFLVVQTVADPAAMIGTVRHVIAELDPNLAAGNVMSLRGVVDQSLGFERFMASLFALFAALAFILAAVGLYGVVSYNVNQRMHEMGLRMALGAAAWDIKRLVVRHVLVLVGGGLAIGAIGLVVLRSVIHNLLFGVRASDPLTLAVATILLLAVAVAAATLPATRAARVDPVRVLRAD